MRLVVTILLLLGLIGCQQESEPAAPPTGAEVELPATPAAPSEGALEARLAGRSAADRERDAGRKPAAVLTFLGVEPGMTALDLFAASGWYTEVLSLAVGENGKVYAQNTEFLLSMREGANDKAMTERLAGGRLPNVERVDREINDLQIPPGSVDVAMFALNFHDVYNNGGPEAALGLLQAIYMVLKPGGVLGLIDHSGAPGNDNKSLHRIEQEQVLAVVRQSPFEVDGESDLLRNPADDLSKNVFDPALRGQTDRFLLRLKK